MTGVLAGAVTVPLTASAMLWDGPGTSLRSVPVDQVILGSGDALVRIELSTVCGSDLHTLSGRRPGPTPSVLGHETVGRVVALGPGTGCHDVRGHEVRTGDRVAVGIYAACGRCARCVAGHEQKCEVLFKYGHVTSGDDDILTGGYATHLHVRSGTPLVRVRGLPASVAAPLGCATATAVACVGAALSGAGSRIDLTTPSRSLTGLRATVLGAGLVGLLTSALLADQGAQVTTVDPNQDRRDRAVRFGAARALDPEDRLPASDLLLELSGSPAAVGGALDATTIGGTIVLAGTVSPGAPLGWEAETVVRKLITVRGVHNYRPIDLATAASWSEGAVGRLPLEELAGPVFSLTDIESAAHAARHTGALRVGITSA